MKLNVHTRELAGKQVKQMRKEGSVPAVLYGPKFASQNARLDEKEFRKVFNEVGYSNVIDLKLDDGSEEQALVKEVQANPVNDKLLHISLYVIDAKTEITAEVPVTFVGVSPAEKNNLGFVSYALDSVAVRCLPKNLPSELTVDVSGLVEAGQSILVQDIQLPAGVEFDSKQDVNAAIALIVEAQKIEDVLAEIEADNAAVAEAATEGAEEGAEEAGAESESEAE
jgi:large subunit ribosomal protein L25